LDTEAAEDVRGLAQIKELAEKEFAWMSRLLEKEHVPEQTVMEVAEHDDDDQASLVQGFSRGMLSLPYGFGCLPPCLESLPDLDEAGVQKEVADYEKDCLALFDSKTRSMREALQENIQNSLSAYLFTRKEEPRADIADRPARVGEPACKSARMACVDEDPFGHGGGIDEPTVMGGAETPLVGHAAGSGEASPAGRSTATTIEVEEQGGGHSGDDIMDEVTGLDEERQVAEFNALSEEDEKEEEEEAHSDDDIMAELMRLDEEREEEEFNALLEEDGEDEEKEEEEEEDEEDEEEEEHHAEKEGER